MISKTEYGKLFGLYKQIGHIESKIEEHVSDILEMIAEMFGGELDWWVFPAGEINGEVYGGNINLNGQSFKVYWESSALSDDPIYQNYCLSDEVPTDWLFMPISEIKLLILENIECRKKEKEAALVKKREQRLKREAKKASLKESAAKKLTAEERKALGINI